MTITRRKFLAFASISVLAVVIVMLAGALAADLYVHHRAGQHHDHDGQRRDQRKHQELPPGDGHRASARTTSSGRIAATTATAAIEANRIK